MAARRRVPVLSIFLLLLMASAAALWARSPRHADMLGIFSPAGHLHGVASDRAGLLWFASDVPFGREYALTADVMSAPREDFAPVRDTLYDKPHERWHFLGFRFSNGTLGLSGLLTCHYSALIVPYWFILLALLPLPARAAFRAWVRWRWKRNGLCLGCGYDIRASAGRCPECGSEIPLARQPQPRSGSRLTAVFKTSRARAKAIVTYRRNILLLLILTWCGIGLALLHRRNFRAQHALEFEAAEAGLYHVVPRIALNDVPLVEAIEQIERAANVKIEMRWDSLRQAGVTQDQPVTLAMDGYAVERVLDVLVGECSFDISYEPRGPVIVVANQKVFAPVVRVYDLRELLPSRSLPPIPWPPPTPAANLIMFNGPSPPPPLTWQAAVTRMADDLGIEIPGNSYRHSASLTMDGRLIAIGTRGDQRQIVERMPLVRPTSRRFQAWFESAAKGISR